MIEVANYFKHARSEIVPFLPTSYCKVLEIGCGAGGFGSQLAAPEIWGVEPDANASQVASKLYNKVLSGYYENVATEIPDDYFDLIICNDVIEHIKDHDEFLFSLRGKLKDGGKLVGSVPNVRYYKNLYHLLFLKRWDYVDAGILDRTHLRFFTEISLRKSLEKAGFQVEKLEGVNSALKKGFKKNIFKTFMLGIVTFLTLGSASDVRFLQFAFRARK